MQQSPTSSNAPLLRKHDVLEHQLLSVWVDAAHVGMVVIDDTGRVVMVNPGACRKFGVDGTHVLNLPLKALLHGIEGSLNLIQWLSTPGFDGERQVTVKAADATRHLLLKTSSLRTESGERYKVVAVTDVTQLTQALHDGEQLHRQWQAINAGVVISDARLPGMPVTFVNSVFEKMTGYSKEESIGRNCSFLQGADTDQPGLIPIRTAIQTRTNGYGLLRNYRKDGSMFLNELFISPVKDAAGEVSHFVGIQHLRVWDPTPARVV